MGLFDSNDYGPGETPNQPGLLAGIFNDPRKLAQLQAFGLALAKAGGPSPYKGQQLGGIADALGSFNQAGSQFDQQEMQKKMQQFQLENLKAQAMLHDAQGKKALQGMDFQNQFLSRLSGNPSQQPQGGATVPMGEMGAPPQSSGGGISSLSLNDLGMAAVAGVPGAKELLDIKKVHMQGTQFEQGKTYRFENGTERYMPKLGEGMMQSPRGEVSNAPGYTSALAQSVGATEGAKAGLDIVQVPDGQGGMISMPRSRAAQALGAGVPLSVAGAGESGKPFVATQAPGQPVQFGRAPSAADVTYGGETAKAAAETYKNIQTAGMKAPGLIAKYKQLGDLLAGVEGNKLSSTGVEVAKFANSLGMKIDPKLPNKEAAAAITNELALSLRDPSSGGGMPGAMSDADRNFLMQAVPSLSQSSAGRKTMIEMRVKVAEREADVAKKARMWAQRYGRIDATAPDGKDFQTLLQEWSDANPLFK